MKLGEWSKEAEDMTAALKQDKKLVGQMKERFAKSKVSLEFSFKFW